MQKFCEKMQKFSKKNIAKTSRKTGNYAKTKILRKNNGNILAIKLHSSKKTKFLEYKTHFKRGIFAKYSHFRFFRFI